MHAIICCLRRWLLLPSLLHLHFSVLIVTPEVCRKNCFAEQCETQCIILPEAVFPIIVAPLRAATLISKTQKCNKSESVITKTTVKQQGLTLSCAG